MSTVYAIAFGPAANRRYVALAEGWRPVWTKDVALADKHSSAAEAEEWAARWLTPDSYTVVALAPTSHDPGGTPAAIAA